jgi:putative flippase GtrA
MKRLFNGKFGQQARFVAVGAWNTLFGYGVFCGLNALFEGILKNRTAAYMLAMTIGSVLAIANAFIFHKHITFRSKTSGFALMHEFLRFSCTYIFSFIVSLVMMPVLVEGFKLKPHIAAAVLIVVGMAVSYLGHSKFSFKAHHKEKA